MAKKRSTKVLVAQILGLFFIGLLVRFLYNAWTPELGKGLLVIPCILILAWVFGTLADYYWNDKP